MDLSIQPFSRTLQFAGALPAPPPPSASKNLTSHVALPEEIESFVHQNAWQMMIFLTPGSGSSPGPGVGLGRILGGPFS